jgi:hypothetical protein
VNAGVVKFNPLADPVRAAAQDHYFFCGRRPHFHSPRFISRIVVGVSAGNSAAQVSTSLKTGVMLSSFRRFSVRRCSVTCFSALLSSHAICTSEKPACLISTDLLSGSIRVIGPSVRFERDHVSNLLQKPGVYFGDVWISSTDAPSLKAFRI